ncbi:cyclic nucleotide-binding domain-containing protein [Leptospira perdikensis]|uniref:Cyclic nucleotide-binding domain-containing protein n=1 Tax=Leptospira perdikensis TaxID=2484948 RepID=A0A4R9JGQ6_9LEPT|nr:cyclic nucleotide-binding domain-containing protein [Leptospira perdikensis]TGL40941.1 cyclic nucleotide-binding domain-containing protein [Leptospira perdikensis]
MNTKVESLKKIYLFQKLNQDELLHIAEKIREVHLPPRNVLYDMGEEAESMYIIKYGTLQISTATSDGDDVNLITLGEGDHFGELPFFDDEKRSAKVEAKENSELYELRYSDLHDMFSKNKEMELKFYKEVTHYYIRRLRKLTHDLAYARELRKRFA